MPYSVLFAATWPVSHCVLKKSTGPLVLRGLVEASCSLEDAPVPDPSSDLSQSSKVSTPACPGGSIKAPPYSSPHVIHKTLVQITTPNSLRYPKLNLCMLNPNTFLEFSWGRKILSLMRFWCFLLTVGIPL